jgi:amino acid adenylation domain-containing protein
MSSTGDSSRLAKLSAAKLSLLERRLRGEAADADVPRVARRARAGDAAPLSFAQQRLWFLDRLVPGLTAYNIGIALRLSNRLDVPALGRALAEIVRRHEILRTRIVSVDGRPSQVVSPAAASELETLNLSSLPEAEREAELRRLVDGAAEHHFDLERGPLFHARLLKLGEDDHALLVTLHHIVSDGWSTSVMVNELAALYEAFSAGRPSPLEELPFQYADYAAWQRENLRGEVLERQLRYWRAKLGDAQHVLELPSDRPHPPKPTYVGARRRVRLSPRAAASLYALAEQEGATMFMALLAAFNLLLYRYTGQDDILVGTPAAGRDLPETERLIGFFVNTLVMRTRLDAGQTFRGLLRQVRETALEAYEHQGVPFEKVIEELQPERQQGHTPLVQAMLAVQNATAESPGLTGLEARALVGERLGAKFDLTLTLTEGSGRIGGALEYSTDLFDEATAERMARHFENLVEAAAAAPEEKISRLPMLTDDERHQLLVEWNRTARAFPRDATIQQLFEEQAERQPTAVALVFEGEPVTYGELNARANRLARHLRGLGVGPDALVAVALERGVETAVALLAVLKAGGAYVPLDPDYPLERLSFMLEDSRASVLLTQGSLAGRLPPLAQLTFVSVDEERERIAAEDDRNVEGEAGGESLAYVIYTSGSTGIPKGVAVPHRAVLRLLFGVDYAALGPAQTLLQMAAVSFDASTFELWGALLHGSRCVLMPTTLPGFEHLGRVIKEENVTTMWLTASLFDAVVDGAPEALAPVRQLLIGGEALSVAHVRRAQELLPATQIINGYGPTESTTFACCYQIPTLDESPASIPIGRPIANTRVYLLDAEGEPVPVGVRGELHIGGEGLARGYLNRPDLTAERFVPDPFSPEPGARLYRTGDLAHYLSDGRIEFLGRLDEQVKVRGFRVEPGEVEALLAGHERVSECAVVVRDDAPGGGRRLVAYVVARAEGDAPSAEELRRFVAERLPEYMRPAAFVPVAELPRTPSGKVDRRRLPAPADGREAEAETFVAPRTPAEAALADIWSQLLGVERVGVEDDFFELGGHSLLIPELMSQVGRAFQTEVPLVVFFDDPTVAGLARAVEAATRGEQA